MALGLGSAKAATVAYATDESAARTVTSVSTFKTTGADLSGMRVTALFSDGFAQSGAWAASGLTSGGVTSPGFNLNLGSDSFHTTWKLLNTGSATLLSLLLEGVFGDTVFDRTNPRPGTDGSAQGRDFAATSRVAGEIEVTYSGPVKVEGADSVGDLWTTMLIDFAGINGVASGSSFTFRQDTDNAAFSVVPAPATLPLIFSAFGVAFLFARRARRAAQ